MSEPITLSGLREKIKPWEDVDIEGIGTFRVGKLSLLNQLEILDIVGEIARDEEGRPANTKDNIELMVRLVCKSLRGPNGEHEFDCQEGFDAIMALPNGPFMILANKVIGQVGIGVQDGGNPIQEGLDAAKND